LIKINDLNRDLNQMIFLLKKVKSWVKSWIWL